MLGSQSGQLVYQDWGLCGAEYYPTLVKQAYLSFVNHTFKVQDRMVS